MIEILEFFAGPIGRWLVIAALVGSAVFAAGVHERNIGWNERDVQAKAEIQAERDAVKRATDKSKADALATEQAHAKALAAIQAQYQQELDHEKSQHQKDLASVLSGAIKLRDAAASCGDSPDGSKATGTPSGSDAPKGAELSPAASSFLLDLANEADDITRQLTACQAVITSDRKEKP